MFEVQTTIRCITRKPRYACDACVAAKLTDSWYDEEYENAEYKKFKSEADEDIFEREAILDMRK